MSNFLNASEGVPCGHTTFSWSAPVVASPGLCALAASGNAAASLSVSAAGNSVPYGHSAFSWTFGSAAASAAPQELVNAVQRVEEMAASVQTNCDHKTENHMRVEAALVLQGTAG